MHFKWTTIQAGSGWQTVPLDSAIANGERLTVIPAQTSAAQGKITTASFDVPSTSAGYTLTDPEIKSGQLVQITASGIWDWYHPASAQGGTYSYEDQVADANFRLPGVRKHALIAQIGSGSWFYVGTSLTFIADQSGQLRFSMNDQEGQWSNNSGNLQVEVAVHDWNCGLKGRIDEGSEQYSTEFPIELLYDDIITTGGDLQLAAEDCDSGEVPVLVIVGAPGVPNHDDNCPVGNDAELTSPNPIRLRDGDKRLTETDLKVQTPAGALSLTRFYRQSRQTDTNYQFMGLGWSHNHKFTLDFTGGTGYDTEVFLPAGGSLKLLETPASSGHYEALDGSTSTLDLVSGEYVLTVQDKTQYIFDGSSPYLLDRRVFPSGETWSYSHYTSSDGADLEDKLKRVTDDYGNYLEFTYIRSTDPGPPPTYKHEQLYRVTDHTGRYVEFDYSENNAGGSSLLATVFDVHDQDWLYTYDANDHLVKRESPKLDDSDPDSRITLEELGYTLNGSTITDIIQKRGDSLLETAYKYQADGNNITEETIAGKTIRHNFANGVYLGTRSTTNSINLQALNANYRPDRQVDGNGNSSDLTWSTDGKHLQAVKDARAISQSTNDETSFTYDSQDRLATTVDVEDRKTTYMYDANQRQPGLIIVSTDATEIDVEGDMEVVGDWGTVGTGVTNELGIAPDSGDYCRRVVADANNEGIQSSATFDLLSGKSYTVTARVYPISGTVKLKIPGTKASSSGTGTWQTLTINPTNVASNLNVKVVADGGAADFLVDTVIVEEDGVAIDVEGHMETKDGWDDEQAPVSNVRYPGPVAGSACRHVVVDTAGEGVESSNTFDLTANKTYLLVARVYPIQGQVKMAVTGTTALDTLTSDTGSNLQTWQTLRVVYTPASTITSKKLQFLSEGGAAEFYVDAVHLLEITDLLSWQDFRYDHRERVVDEATINVETAAVIQRTARTYDPDHGLLTFLDQYGADVDATTTEYTYDTLGRVVKTYTSSLFGTCQYSYTVYDDVDRVLATVCGQTDTTPPADTAAAIAMYTANPTTTRVTTHTYDVLGRRIETTSDAGASYAQTTRTVYDSLGRQTMTIANYNNPLVSTDPDIYTYAAPENWAWVTDHWEDGSSTTINHGTENNENLISETVYNARGSVRLQRDVLGNVNLFGYDDDGRLVKTVVNAATPDHNNEYDADISVRPDKDNFFDPSLDNYPYSGTLSSDPDKDIISTQAYDFAGNLVNSVDVSGAATLTGHDELNRPVRTIRGASQPNYDVTSDLKLDDYLDELSAASDKDLVEETQYDNLGRVIRTRRLLYGVDEWDVTLYGYNSRGQQIKTIQHAVDAGTPHYDISADPDLSAYSASSDPDKDITTTTEYDGNGRVLKRTDALGNVTYFVYDGRGRQIKTIANYTDDSYTSPNTWTWNAGEGVWKDQTTPTPKTISHGAGADENLITETQYDGDGRVLWTRDTQGKQNWNVYDTRGRQRLTVTNAQSDPTNWEWQNNRWEDGSSGAIAHGSDNDENIISETQYDDRGQVSATRDVRGELTVYIYDTVGRRVRTVTNYVPQGNPVTDPTGWIWKNGQWLVGTGAVAVDHGTNNDQNLISDTVYNVAGQVVSARDTRGTQTTFTYDSAGRRLQVTVAAGTPNETTNYTVYDHAGRVEKAITNYVAQGSSNPRDWEWNYVNTRWEDGSGNAINHGNSNDQNLITANTYDAVGRRLAVRDSEGNVNTTSFFKSGQINTTTDAEAVITAYRYDQAQRRTHVVQNYQENIRIAFSADAETTGVYHVYTTKLDGSDLIKLNDSDQSNLGNWMDWSPDGQQLAFDVDGAMGEYIVKINADGSNPVTVTHTGLGSVTPSWSPDGEKIAFAYYVSVPVQRLVLVIMIPDGKIETELENIGTILYDSEASDVSVWYPDWSPDGKQIVFALKSNRTSNGDICILDSADGGNFVNLTASQTTDTVNEKPSWSPDGTKIAFQSNRDAGAHDIWVMNVDGSDPVNLTSGINGNNFNPSWSYDGKSIVFYSNRDGNREIYIMDADGSNQTRVTNNSYQNYFPVLSPPLTDLSDSADPGRWAWDATDQRWEDENGNAINHGTNKDENIVVVATYDKSGRMTNLRDPLGRLNRYVYDKLGRRAKFVMNYNAASDPATWVWDPVDSRWEDSGGNAIVHDSNYPTFVNDQNLIRQTDYGYVSGGKTETTLTDMLGYETERQFDQLGRLTSIDYNDTATPKVTFTYNAAGNRESMTENNGTSDIRITEYSYDDMRRLTQVDFDADANGTPDETVSYEYDRGGQRTKLTLPGNLDITYTYDNRGRLVGMTDWDGNTTSFVYDGAGRHAATARSNQLSSYYRYDTAGRLRKLSHANESKPRSQFVYEVDSRGNRTKATEYQATATSTSATYDKDAMAVTYTNGTWSDNGDFKQSSDTFARMEVDFDGNEVVLTYGLGADHSIFDVYIDGSLWQSLDGYAASTGERSINIQLDERWDGTDNHTLEIRNRREQNLSSTGYKVQFKQLAVLSTTYAEQTWDYTYDALARLLSADKDAGTKLYEYTYDVAGNRLSETIDSGTPTSFTYNAANQLTSDGTNTYTYDANGNLIGDGTNTYTWDRANRMLTAPGSSSYKYDGLGNRIQQTVSSTVTDYLLDLQPGLARVLVTDDGSDTYRYVHSPRGIHAQELDNGSTQTWSHMLTDGLGSVRGTLSDALAVNDQTDYKPFGVQEDSLGTKFAFTGELLDDNGLQHHRARYYNPALGIWASLDPFEGAMQNPMSLNRYGYVSGNVVNRVDPTGMFDWCTGEIEPGDTLDTMYEFVRDYFPGERQREFLHDIGNYNEGHPIYTRGLGEYNINQWAFEPLYPNPPLNISPRILAAAEVRMGRSCNIATPTPSPPPPTDTSTPTPTPLQFEIPKITLPKLCLPEFIKKALQEASTWTPPDAVDHQEAVRKVLITEIEAIYGESPGGFNQAITDYAAKADTYCLIGFEECKIEAGDVLGPVFDASGKFDGSTWDMLTDGLRPTPVPGCLYPTIDRLAAAYIMTEATREFLGTYNNEEGYPLNYGFVLTVRRKLNEFRNEVYPDITSAMDASC